MADELAKLRTEEDLRRSNELSEISSQVAHLKDVTAEQVRAAAAEALAAELGKVRTDATAFVRETVIPLAGSADTSTARDATAPPPVHADAALGDQGAESAGNNESEDGEDVVQDYYSLWRAEQPSPEQVGAHEAIRGSRLRQVGFALGAAACALIGVMVGMWWMEERRTPPPESGAPEVAVALAGDQEPETLQSDALDTSQVLQAGAASVLAPEIEDAPGWVEISSEVPVEIFADGERLGTTEDGRLSLPAGIHQVEVANDRLGFRDTVELEIEAGELATHSVVLPFGYLRVDGPPGADVWIEGRLVGQTPLRDTPTPIGTREVVVRHPEAGERRELVVIGTGTVTVFRLETAGEPPPAAEVSDDDAAEEPQPAAELGDNDAAEALQPVPGFGGDAAAPRAPSDDENR